MLSRKSEIKKFKELNPEIVKQIPNVNDDLELRAAGEKLISLKEQLADIENKLNVHYEPYYEGGSSLPSPEQDALDILNGTPFVVESTDTQKQDLSRRRTALAKAIEIQQGLIAELESKIILRNCKAFEELGNGYVKKTIKAFEQVELALKDQEKFFLLLSTLGYRQDRRPARWTTWPYELQTLYGGISSLTWYLDSRRASVGLATKGKSHKKL